MTVDLLAPIKYDKYDIITQSNQQPVGPDTCLVVIITSQVFDWLTSWSGQHFDSSPWTFWVTWWHNTHTADKTSQHYLYRGPAHHTDTRLITEDMEDQREGPGRGMRSEVLWTSLRNSHCGAGDWAAGLDKSVVRVESVSPVSPMQCCVTSAEASVKSQLSAQAALTTCSSTL